MWQLSRDAFQKNGCVYFVEYRCFNKHVFCFRDFSVLVGIDAYLLLRDVLLTHLIKSTRVTLHSHTFY